MKIAILTLMHGYNYGGVLQCYALRKTITNMGHQAEVLNFHPSKKRRDVNRILSVINVFSKGRTNELVDSLKFGSKIVSAFSEFRNNILHLEEPVYTLETLNKHLDSFDCLIVGSDQVWNLNWDYPAYFLEGINRQSLRKIAYAPCFGGWSWDETRRQEIREKLIAFDSISVRSSFSQSIVKEVLGVEAPIVCDPTILIDLGEFSTTKQETSDPFGLVYALGRERFFRRIDEIVRFCREKRLNLKVIKSNVLQPWLKQSPDYELVQNPSVSDWVGIFGHASYIFTDSFHGTLFGVRNRIPVYNFLGNSASSHRVRDISEKYGLNPWLNDQPIHCDFWVRPYSYNTFREIEKHRESSQDFLSHAIF